MRRRVTRRFVFRYAPFLLSPEKAARRMVRLATAPADELTNGALYGPGSPIRPNPRVFNAVNAARLWASSAAALAAPAT